LSIDLDVAGDDWGGWLRAPSRDTKLPVAVPSGDTRSVHGGVLACARGSQRQWNCARRRHGGFQGQSIRRSPVGDRQRYIGQIEWRTGTDAVQTGNVGRVI